MITRKIAPALAAGCSVVIKPPSETPYSCAALAKLAAQAGIPGKLMQECSLELGGNAPFIFFDDADLELAAEGAMFCKFRCTGQTCVCANRIIVQKSIAQKFTALFVQKVEALVVGPGLSPSTTQGPLVNASSVEKVNLHVSDALSKGGKLETGGSSPDHAGYLYRPTVLSNVTTDMLVANDETLAPIFTFETEAGAVKLANETEFGLAGYFFAAEAPVGGVKESGYGREGSMYGLAEYQGIKSVSIGNLNM
ncbi:succinate-semialdehyde dehydrogenase i [Venturia nashicola]|uniref:Succinate-semialdehyde dehydrogenase i n=1 Tax=Venturia nashicola TaxID=86259 RepID=A0A4Z1P465_9PEZI|nr:succinate-semialdehyde dehydrogenase i [Venturia nashicola]